jgi:hypothetical protein
LDDHDLDIDAVLSSLPTITEGQITYSLVRRDRTGGDATPLSLTTAGLTHLERFEPVVRTLLRILDQLAEARAKVMFDPQNVVEVTIPIDRLTPGLDMSGMMSVDLRGLLAAEPATWHNQVFQGEGSAWFIRVSPLIRRFRGVQTVEDYIDRLRAWIQPTVAAVPPPIPGSPFGLVAAVDYLDVVWRLKFGSPLVTLPGAERVAWLATEATSPAEFNGRLSALGEVLKGIVVPGAAKDRPLRRLEALLTRDLPPKRWSG